MPSYRSSCTALGLALFSTACPNDDIAHAEGTSSDTSGATEHDADTGPPYPVGFPIDVRGAVDILFVIDDSGSMAGPQGNLAAGVQSLISVLETSELAADYRIGITTTDNGNPRCLEGGEKGRLVATSCRDRLSDFVLTGPTTQDFSGVCLNTCSHETLEIVPTPTMGDTVLAPRPWIENNLGRSNLGAGVSIADALACVLPQGVNGCEFESPLESMRNAIIRSDISHDPSRGFMRDTAMLVIVFLTNEEDCSYTPENRDIFSPYGNRVFWSDPDADAPTSAVCWNAGVRCTEDATSGNQICAAQDYDISGQEPEYASDTVLHPIDRYVSQLREIEDKKWYNGWGENIFVTVIAGVPQDYPTTPIPFPKTPAGSSNPNFVSEFGVGPGCVSSTTEAVPPVRMAEFAREFLTDADDNNLFSVCGSDYAAAFQRLGEQISEAMPPLCVAECVADTHPETPSLEPSCTLQTYSQLNDRSVVLDHLLPCGVDGTVPPGQTRCYNLITRPEEMHPQCASAGLNLEVELVQVPDPSLLGSSVFRIYASCELSENRRVDCPGLPY